MFWRKRKKPANAKNWMDDYAPEDVAEAAYFYGRSNAAAPAEDIVSANSGRNYHARAGRTVAAGLGLLVIACVGGGMYALANKDTLNHRQTVPKSTSQASHVIKPKLSSAAKQYESANLHLKFSYPADWRLSEDQKAITLRSPQNRTTAIDKAGAKTPVTVQMQIQPPQTSLPDFANRAATAIRPSETIYYSAPGATQRPSTNLSFLRFSGNDTETMDALYVTGPTSYALSQNVAESALTAADPLISVRFVYCADNSCVQPRYLRAAPRSWQDDAYAAEVRSIIQSLSL